MESKVIAEIAVIPVGTGSTGLSTYVAAAIKVLDSTPGITYKLAPMGTVIEGTMRQVMSVMLKMHEAPFSQGVQRVVTSIRIDDRRDKQQTMMGKVEDVKKLVPTAKV
jgi:uncharacterized protein (TIGR00106 family)